MKITKLLLVTGLIAGIASLSYAGPSPQFWDQQAKNQQAQKAKGDTQAKTQPAASVAVCASCNCAAMKKS